MTHFRLLALLASLLLLASCSNGGRLRDDDDTTSDDDDSGIDGDGTGDDDDTTAGDDDDTTAGDDDDTTAGDDDDTTAGDDDDDDDDDDDTTPIGPPPDDPTGMENETYCLDWSTVNIIEPAGLLTLLNTVAGIDLTQYPLLMEPTTVDVANSQIFMMMTGASQGTCNQDLSVSTVDLTATQPGSYTPPQFIVGPGDFSTVVSSFALNIFDLEISGQFSQDNLQVTQGAFNGNIDITAYASTACWLLSCFPCPANSALECVSFVADQAVWDVTTNGPLVYVP